MCATAANAKPNHARKMLRPHANCYAFAGRVSASAIYPLSFAEMVLARLVRATQRISKDSAGSASIQNSQTKKSNRTNVKENVARICVIGKKQFGPLV